MAEIYWRQKITALLSFAFVQLYILTFASVTAQVLEGKVRDANSYRQIPGVNVFIPGLSGVESDANGRFRLDVSRTDSNAVLVFQHVGYDSLLISLSEAKARSYFDLTARIIPLTAIETEATREQSRIQLDIPQSVTVLEAREFEMRGYLDAGDLLRNEQSIQIEEDIRGGKLLSIRGGNPDEVVVLYHGIKINSAYDQTFDFSLIDTEDVERFEVIKGSNSSLYGPEAFSGVVNIIPRRQRDYRIRFRQRIGSYASGDWGLHLNGSRGPLAANYSYKRGASIRTLSGAGDRRDLLNRADHHNAGLSWILDGSAANGFLDLLFLRSDLDYENERDVEQIENLNQLTALHWDGRLGPVDGLAISAGWQTLAEEQRILVFGGFAGAQQLQRAISNDAIHLRLEKSFGFSAAEILTSYQFEKHQLDFDDQRFNVDAVAIGLESAKLSRNHHGGAAILKWHFQPEGRSLQTADFDISLRYDDIEDLQRDAVVRGDGQATAGIFDENGWQEATIKFSSFLAGQRRDFAFKAFMNYGTNLKFPSLLQQISAPVTVADDFVQDSIALQPEENRSLEVAGEFTWELANHNGINGFIFGAGLFRNIYKNKFRVFVTPGAPIAFYDNAPTAEISGIELQSGLFAFSNKIKVHGSASFYNISEKLAFPFKYETKQLIKSSIDHRGYSLQLTWFNEGEQVGWIRQPDSGFVAVELPSFQNLDVHFSKFIELYQLRFTLNASVRNLLSDEIELSGLALRDRRYYLTFAAQW